MRGRKSAFKDVTSNPQEVALIKKMMHSYNERLRYIKEAGNYKGALPERLTAKSAADIIQREGIAKFISMTSTSASVEKMKGQSIAGYKITANTASYSPSSEGLNIINKHIEAIEAEKAKEGEYRAQIDILKEEYKRQSELSRDDNLSSAMRLEAANAAHKIRSDMQKLTHQLTIIGQPMERLYKRDEAISNEAFQRELARAKHGYSLNTEVILDNLEQAMREVGSINKGVTHYTLGRVKAMIEGFDFHGTKIQLSSETEIEDLFKDIIVSVYLPSQLGEDSEAELYKSEEAIQDFNTVMASKIINAVGRDKIASIYGIDDSTIEGMQAVVNAVMNEINNTQEVINAESQVRAKINSDTPYSKHDESEIIW